MQKNVYGGALKACCMNPVTGFFRDGFCRTAAEDAGAHVVCAEVTRAFLEFSAARGNDLSTPVPEYDFPGLKPGDRWCLCALRWLEAEGAGFAPPVILAATHESVLKVIPLQKLQEYATA